MKIAHIGPPSLIPPKDYGGTQRLIFVLAKKQAELGHDVTVFAGPGSSIPGCKCISLINVDWMEKSWFRKKILGTRHMIKSYLKIGKDFDIIHNHVGEEGIAFSFLAKTPVLTTMHGATHKKYPQKAITQICSITRKTKVVGISANAYDQNKKLYGNDLIGYVYNCIEPSRFKFIKNPSKKHHLELCFFGLIAPHKGAHIAIKLAERLHKNGHDVRLKIAGKTHKTHQKYAKKICSLVENKPYIEVIFNIPPQEHGSLFGNSDACLFPSLWEEAFGLVIIESLYCGTPVIGFSNGAVKEIIKNEINGFSCKTENEMYDAIFSINKIQRENCNSYVLRNFSVDFTFKKYMEYYEQVIKKNARQ